MLLTVFFDADVLIAGSASRSGSSFLLLQLCELGLLRGITCRHVLEECRRNIKKKLPEAESVFNQIVERTLQIVDDPAPERLQRIDPMVHPEDAPILAAAVQSAADFLLTFNVKHFRFDTEIPLRVCKPGELLREVRSRLNKLAD